MAQGALNIKADTEVTDAAGEALDQYKNTHGLANRGEALAAVLPMIQRAALLREGDTEAERMVAQVKSLTAAIEVEANALATRVATAKETEGAKLAQQLADAQAALEATQAERDAAKAAAETLRGRLAKADQTFRQQAARISELEAQLNAVLGLKQQAQPQQQ